MARNGLMFDSRRPLVAVSLVMPVAVRRAALDDIGRLSDRYARGEIDDRRLRDRWEGLALAVQGPSALRGMTP